MAQEKQQIKHILLAIIVIFAIAIVSLCSEKKPNKIIYPVAKPTPSSDTSSSDAAPATTTVAPISPTPETTENNLQPLPSEEEERAKIENMNWVEVNQASPEPQQQTNNGSTELPDDLKAQLELGEIPLPEDIRRQLEDTNNDVPEDIQKALDTPPIEEPSEETN